MRLVVVDEADKVIGVKDRNELKPTDIYRVARLLIINSKGQLLLAQRALIKKKDPGVWGLAVEGTVEEGEDYETNIRKEAEEELAAVKWYNPLVLRQEVAEKPDQFGYNFSRILETVWPLLIKPRPF